jgi:hypothetical protein
VFGLHPNRSLPVDRVALEEAPVDSIDLTSGEPDGFRVRTLPMDDRDRVGVSRQLVPATAPRHRRRASGGRGLSDLVHRIDDLRARLVLLRTTPDCPPTVAYAACRRLPAALLDLCDVQVSRRPAAPLGWGSPIAFVDGRRACSALIAAVLADHLAGGVR